MGWTGRVLLSSSNPGAWNTERTITMITKTSQATISTIGIDIGKLELMSESVTGQKRSKSLGSLTAAFGGIADTMDF